MPSLADRTHEPDAARAVDDAADDGPNIAPVSADQSAEPGVTNIQEVSGPSSQLETSIPDHATVAHDTLEPPQPDMSVVRLVQKADHSAGRLVNLLVRYVPSFRDEAHFNKCKVRLYKRAQIFVADLWAAFDGTEYGEFHDIEHLTMFAGSCSRLTKQAMAHANSQQITGFRKCFARLACLSIVPPSAMQSTMEDK